MSETAVYGGAINSEIDDEDYDEDEEVENSFPELTRQSSPLSAKFEKDGHLMYLKMMYELLPQHYLSPHSRTLHNLGSLLSRRNRKCFEGNLSYNALVDTACSLSYLSGNYNFSFSHLYQLMIHDPTFRIR